MVGRTGFMWDGKITNFAQIYNGQEIAESHDHPRAQGTCQIEEELK